MPYKIKETAHKKCIFVVSIYMRSAIILLALFIVSTACATINHAPKSGSKYARIKEASVQRILPGRPEGKIRNEYKITITWLSREKPQAIYCYRDNAWWQCMISRYGDAITDMQQIIKGDVLDLIPVNPAEAPLQNFTPINKTTILFKTKKTDWLCLNINNITRKPDLALP